MAQIYGGSRGILKKLNPETPSTFVMQEDFGPKAVGFWLSLHRRLQYPPSSGASSTTTLALVPPTPNELTAAHRGSGPEGHGVSVVGTESRVPSNEM